MKTKSLSHVLILCTVAAVSTSCATTRDSILLGAGMGAGAGGAVGFAAGNQGAVPTVIGAATGAVTGGLIGYVIHKINEKNEPTSAALGPAKPATPFLTKPEVRSVWVPDKIEGNQYIQGHYIFLIEKQSNWSEN